jgi:hypothetical protein
VEEMDYAKHQYVEVRDPEHEEGFYVCIFAGFNLRQRVEQREYVGVATLEEVAQLAYAFFIDEQMTDMQTDFVDNVFVGRNSDTSLTLTHCQHIGNAQRTRYFKELTKLFGKR